MKKMVKVLAVAAVLVVGLVGFNKYRAERLPIDRLRAMAEAETKLKEAETDRRAAQVASETTKPTEAGAAITEVTAEPVQAETKKADMEPFKVKIELSTGPVVLKLQPEWAPLGVDRFREMLEAGILQDARFFRVVPDFVVQFGIPADPKAAAKWRTNTIKDDPVKHSNERGTIVFATSGKDSRTTQLFINLADNKRLDAMGFAPIGEVVEGMDNVEAINSEYGQEPNQGAIQMQGNAYLEEHFPNLDYIKSVTIIEDKAAAPESGDTAATLDEQTGSESN